MKKVAVLSSILIIFAVTVIINYPLASAPFEPSIQDQNPEKQQVPVESLKSEPPIPSPFTLLLLGSGLIGLIIYRKKHKKQKKAI